MERKRVIPRPAPYNEISYRKIFAAINRYVRRTLSPSRSRSDD